MGTGSSRILIDSCHINGFGPFANGPLFGSITVFMGTKYWASDLFVNSELMNFSKRIPNRL